MWHGAFLQFVLTLVYYHKDFNFKFLFYQMMWLYHEKPRILDTFILKQNFGPYLYQSIAEFV